MSEALTYEGVYFKMVQNQDPSIPDRYINATHEVKAKIKELEAARDWRHKEWYKDSEEKQNKIKTLEAENANMLGLIDSWASQPIDTPEGIAASDAMVNFILQHEKETTE